MGGEKVGEVAKFSTDRILASELNINNFIGVDNLLPNLQGKGESQYLPKTGKVSKFLEGDILHSNIRPYLKKAWRTDIEGGSSADVLIIRPDDIIDSLFLYRQITSDSYFDYVMSGAKGVKMPRGDKNHIMEFSFYIPQLPEQQKIASFLGSVDEWLENLRTQKQNLEHYKKGIMQQIFSQKIRFKDENGNDFPDWKEKRLGEVCEISTNSYFEVDKNCLDGYYLVDMGAISSKGELLIKKMTLNKKGLLEKNDLVMPNRDIGNGDIIGKVALIDEDNKYVLGSNMYKIKSLNDLPKFLFYSINSYLINRQMRKRSNGTSQLQLIRKDVDNVRLQIPSLPEQQKIAEFLSSVDELIESKQKQITQAEEWKKGLMQGLFV